MFNEITERPYEDSERKIKYLGAAPILATSEIETDVTVVNPIKIDRKNRKRKKVLGGRKESKETAQKLEQELAEKEEKRKREEMRRVSLRVLREAETIDEEKSVAKAQKERHKDLMRKYSIDLPWETEKTDEFEFE
ncbi:MAG: hypothetical protein J1F24_05450 [Oscillospiraceae bacterium]|nr:hypothetical protein [Oscillospiraceae bacterium]